MVGKENVVLFILCRFIIKCLKIFEIIVVIFVIFFLRENKWIVDELGVDYNLLNCVIDKKYFFFYFDKF